MAEQPPQPYRHPPHAYALIIGFAATAVAGLWFARNLDTSQAALVATAAFAAVISAAMVISWGAEAAQFFISQGLAVALIALLQVMPEFMVEGVIAWHGEVKNMFANATGSNRLLIGLGWPLVYFTASFTQWRRTGRGLGSIALRSVNVIEVLSLLMASCYYVKLLAFDALTIFDGVFLIFAYVAYMTLLGRLPEEEAESKDDLIAPARLLAEIESPVLNRIAIFTLFLIGGGVMAFVSGPFVESLKTVARKNGISEFDFIQWVAPFLSEFPENVTAFYWARKVRLAPMAMINLISSTVSQFTLLVGMIPIVYATSWALGNIPHVHLGRLGFPNIPMVVGGPQGHDVRAEVMLSWAMTVLGCSQLAKLRFTFWNALLLLFIWIAQFASAALYRRTGLPESTQHAWEAGACLVLAIIELLRNWPRLRFLDALIDTFALIRGSGPPVATGVAAREKRTTS
jgi:cation:H+ antiporter